MVFFCIKRIKVVVSQSIKSSMAVIQSRKNKFLIAFSSFLREISPKMKIYINEKLPIPHIFVRHSPRPSCPKGFIKYFLSLGKSNLLIRLLTLEFLF